MRQWKERRGWQFSKHYTLFSLQIMIKMKIIWIAKSDNKRGKLRAIHQIMYFNLSHDVASGSEITPCIKFDMPLVVYRFFRNVMASKTMLRT